MGGEGEVVVLVESFFGDGFVLTTGPFLNLRCRHLLPSILDVALNVH